MPRKGEGNTATTSSGGASRQSANLKQLRAQVDKLDVQILELINKRANIALDIGKHKVDQGEDIFSVAREEEVFHNVLAAHEKMKGPLSETCIRAVYREIMSGSRALQKVLKIAYLGPE